MSNWSWCRVSRVWSPHMLKLCSNKSSAVAVVNRRRGKNSVLRWLEKKIFFLWFVTLYRQSTPCTLVVSISASGQWSQSPESTPGSSPRPGQPGHWGIIASRPVTDKQCGIIMRQHCVQATYLQAQDREGDWWPVVTRAIILARAVNIGAGAGPLLAATMPRLAPAPNPAHCEEPHQLSQH